MAGTSNLRLRGLCGRFDDASRIVPGPEGTVLTVESTVPAVEGTAPAAEGTNPGTRTEVR